MNIRDILIPGVEGLLVVEEGASKDGTQFRVTVDNVKPESEMKTGLKGNGSLVTFKVFREMGDVTYKRFYEKSIKWLYVQPHAADPIAECITAILSDPKLADGPMVV